MGQLINLKCEKCGYETNLGVGAGMTFNDLERVITFFDKQTQEKIREVVNSNGQKLWYVYKEIGVCEKCGKISAIAVFKTTDAKGIPVEYHARCQCGSADVEIYNADMVEEGKITISCPICGDALKVTVQGYWD